MKGNLSYVHAMVSRKLRMAQYPRNQLTDQLTEEVRIVCMVGRFASAKDQPTLIRSIAHLATNVHLLLIGEGPLRNENERLATELQLRDRIHFLGFRDDVARILKTSDILVQSSNWEGMPIAAIEAMASGGPVIASDVEGLSDVVGDFGILFERGDHLELAKAISHLLDNAVEYERVSRACSARACSFDIQNMLDKYLDLYLKLI